MDANSRFPRSGSSTPTPMPTSTKEKRYQQQIEKALGSFETVEEWADYISFLTRLQKALQLNGGNSVSYIPYAPQISYRLALCLSSKLPNGVHKKALQLYDIIFSALSNDTFNNQISIWLTGILPMISYCSIQLKPTVINLFSNQILAKLSPQTLKLVTIPLILAFLPGLDDENSENFNDFLQLMDNFKKKLGNDTHFWQSFFICVINNPEKRLGALYWCNKRLPVFTSIKSSSATFSDEAKACIGAEPGVLIRAFATSISSTSSMISANDVIVIRGFFDLLLTHLPLDSEVLESVASEKDKELLIKSCLLVTLKKDMSLNRRLWNWLLGPDNEQLEHKITRTKYLSQYSLDIITSIIMDDITSDSDSNSDFDSKLKAYRISLALIMDKWEISHLITPKIFLPIMRSAFKDKSNSKEVFLIAKSFFDSVEAIYIWKDLIQLIIEGKELDLVEYIVSNFDISEEEMVNTHIPMALVSLFANVSQNDDTWLNIVTILSNILPSDFLKLENYETKNYNVKQTILQFYDQDNTIEKLELPWKAQELSAIILQNLVELIIETFDTTYTKFLGSLSELLCNLFGPVVSHGLKSFIDPLIQKMLVIPISTPETELGKQQKNLLVAFPMIKILNQFHKFIDPLDTIKLLRTILSNLFVALISTFPANHQVEAVSGIFELQVSFSNYQIEAGLLKLFSKSTSLQRVRALSNLWTHSNQFVDCDSFLVRPIQYVLDDLYEKDSDDYPDASNFISNVLKGGSANRLLKIITTPLLEFEFFNSNVNNFTSNDDLGKFSYYVSLIVDVMKTDEKHLKESFNNELAVMDNTTKLEIVTTNQWDISTYKSLVFHIVEKVITLKIDKSVLECPTSLKNYYKCIKKTLELFCILLTGNEPRFNKMFPKMVKHFSQFHEYDGEMPRTIELVEIEFLNCILYMLSISESSMVNLNLLHVDDGSTEPYIISFITKGINKTQSTILMKRWIVLLTKSLYLFNESIFSVLLTISDALISKIEFYFKRVINETSEPEISDIEESIYVLSNGLEDLLSIGHSYLLTSILRAKNDKATQNGADGFFGNVIQGVFSIESPSIRTTEENKRYSILLAFQDAIKTMFKMWLWADGKPSITKKEQVSGKSLAYLARKIKFKSRKFLESLIELERQEVIEALINTGSDTDSTIKLLHVLDGGRSQVTLPHIINSILTRLYPQCLDEKQKSSMSSNASVRELARFLSLYMESIDDDTISDIWPIAIQFFKEVTSHVTLFITILPEVLKSVTTLSLKLTGVKFAEQTKPKKEISDLFVKLLMYSLNPKISGNLIPEDDYKANDTKESLDPVGTTSNKDEIPTENALKTQGELLEVLKTIIENLDQIVKETDKVSSCVNCIIVNLVSPQVKSKKINEIPNQTISLISLIGDKHSNKVWRSTVVDCFFDNSFFKSSIGKLKLWEPIMKQWISNDKDRILEVFAKINPPTSTTTNLFNWNESSELENKIFNLKRASYLLLVQPQDYFLNYLDELFKRYEICLNSDSPPAYKADISTLLRVITLRFSEMHLLPYWTLISHDLSNNFLNLQEQTTKELGKLDKPNLKLTLNSCKLLDQLLLLKYDEFNFQEWLYVSLTPEVVVEGVQSDTLSLIDQFSAGKDLKSLKGEAIKVGNFEGKLRPLLEGVYEINSLGRLRTFFASLSLLHYERMYSLNEVDLDACVADVLNDLLVHDEIS